MPTPIPSPDQGDLVFRQNLLLADQRFGRAGFDRQGGKDVLRLVSWHGDMRVALSFPVEAIPVIVAQLQHMHATKTRPGDGDCYAFPRLAAAVPPTVAG